MFGGSDKSRVRHDPSVDPQIVSYFLETRETIKLYLSSSLMKRTHRTQVSKMI